MQVVAGHVEDQICRRAGRGHIHRQQSPVRAELNGDVVGAVVAGREVECREGWRAGQRGAESHEAG